MPAFTLQEAKDRLAAWMEADASLAAGTQSYEVYGRKLTRVDAEQIRANIKFWADFVNKLENAENGVGGSRIRQIIPS